VPRKRIAVVGAGISGLTAAHLLHRDHEVTVFEANDYAGGHTNTIRVDGPDSTHHVDTGFIVLNNRNYPNFERLLAKLGVRTQPSSMSMSVSSEVDDFEYSSASLNGLLATRRRVASPRFVRMLLDVRRFQQEARELLADDADPNVSLGHYLEAKGYSHDFVDRLLVPQAAAVWSADPRQMWEFPARFLVRFFANHGMLGLKDRPEWRVVTGGSARYVEKLTQPFLDRVHLRAPIAAIARHADRVEITPRGHEPMAFDEVVMATHADQALGLLSDPSAAERRILGAIPYQPNEAVLHTDRALLPRRRRAWASWNYHHLADPPPLSTVTYHMNRLQSLRADREFCVTLNRTEAIAPAKVIRKIQYHHPVFTPAGVAAQAERAAISGTDRRTHYAGAYWRWGFHEDGVVSALAVGERFGVTL